MTEDMTIIAEEAYLAAKEILEKARLEQVKARLLAEPDRTLTLKSLSQQFNVSEAQIKSSFTGVYGMSPAAYARSQRMHGAAALLRETDRTVLDIACQFGYDNASKFARAFRDVIGVSPREYRAGAEYDSCAPQLGEKTGFPLGC